MILLVGDEARPREADGGDESTPPPYYPGRIRPVANPDWPVYWRTPAQRYGDIIPRGKMKM